VRVGRSRLVGDVRLLAGQEHEQLADMQRAAQEVDGLDAERFALAQPGPGGQDTSTR
jgi:hypothetical protein